eukprot:4077171-Prymnesium_polylepis.2
MYCSPLPGRPDSSLLFCFAVVVFDWAIERMGRSHCAMFTMPILRSLDHHASHRVLAPRHELDKVGGALRPRASREQQARTGGKAPRHAVAGWRAGARGRA